jgi:ferric-dicitrate binding protein FerR (iron transport regulator)
MKQKDALELLKKYRSGTCTVEEKALLEAWYLEWRDEAPDPRPDELKAAREKTWKDLSARKEWKRVAPFPHRYTVAAVFTLCLLSAGLWFLERHPAEKIAAPLVAPVVAHDAVPGRNKAMLTLADGKIIALDEAKNGKLAEAEGINIRKTADGQIVYEVAPARADQVSNSDAPLKYNEISTPRGGQYRVTMPDGTNVWLNAASSVKYPVKFLQNVRRVELTGEGYFEVSKVHSARGIRIPFVVDTPTESVEVLGTRFNINAYEDEAVVKTTLLEGSVRVSIKEGEDQSADGSLLLVPDQQSVLTGDKLILHKVNAEEIMAWKDGYFSFDHADVKTIMRQLARWYDLEVVYEGEVSPNTYSGKVYRNMNLSKVLEVLSFSQVNFRIEGKKIMIFS